MTDVPQLGPEVFVDDADDISRNRRPSASALLSPLDARDPRGSFITYGLEGPRHRTNVSLGGGAISPGTAGSPSRSPQLSPHRATNSAFSFEAGELSGEDGSANNSRRGSGVSAENVLDVLDNSAWGESIRRSFTMRRPSRT